MAGKRRRLVLLAAILVGVVAEGWAVPIPAPPFNPMAESGAPDAYEYLRQLPPGGVLELPASLQRFERESRYQFLSLAHGHRIVNGQSGYVTPLFSFLAGPQSPLNETARLDSAIAALRAVGVSYLVVHHDEFDDQAIARAWEATMIGERTQFIDSRRFGDITIATLGSAPDVPVRSRGRRIPAAAIRARASQSSGRLPFLFDGNSDTRWLSGSPQRGDEWIALAFDRPRDVAAIRLRMAERSAGDYPREFAVDSVRDDGAETVFHGSVLPALARGILADGTYPDIDLALPPNRSATLRLRQLGTAGRFFWSIHELEVWER